MSKSGPNRRWIAAIALMLFIGGGGQTTRADDVADCNLKDDPDLTIRGCTKLIEAGGLTGDDLAYAYNNRGSAYYNKGDLDRAIADYVQAIEIKPDYALAYTNKGVAYAGKGDPNRAITDHNMAIAIHRRYAAAYNNRGTAYSQMGDLERAIDDYSKAIEYSANYAVAYVNRSRAYRHKGDGARADADCAKAKSIDPDVKC